MQLSGPYYHIDPIKWRVLKNADGKLFLLSDQTLDVLNYHPEKESVTWETSTMRSWLNGYGASSNTGGESGIDYKSDNFLDTAFSANEQTAIATTGVYNATQSDGTSRPNPQWPDISGGRNTNDKIFLLSIEEVNNSSYFTNNASRLATNTAYAAGGGKIGASAGDANNAVNGGKWWLRSPGEDTNNESAAFVTSGGELRAFGAGVNGEGEVARPAFNLDLHSVLFTSAAAGGKADDAVDSSLTAVGDATAEWKLTLLDASRSGFIVTTTSVSTSAGGNVSIAYSGAQTGANEYVSVLLVNGSAEVLYYGRIAQNSASGTATVTIPAGLAEGTYTLKVFSEQYNGDYKTDYASELRTVTLTVGAPVTVNVIENSTNIYTVAAGTNYVWANTLPNSASAAAGVTLSVADNTSVASDVETSLKNAAGVDIIAEKSFYLDLTMSATVGEGSPQTITELRRPVTVTLTVPAIAASEKYTVVREHNGGYTVLDSTFDRSTNKLSFQTDKFSTYAIFVSPAYVLTQIPSVNVSVTAPTAGMRADEAAATVNDLSVPYYVENYSCSWYKVASENSTTSLKSLDDEV